MAQLKRQFYGKRCSVRKNVVANCFLEPGDSVTSREPAQDSRTYRTKPDEVRTVSEEDYPSESNDDVENLIDRIQSLKFDAKPRDRAGTRKNPTRRLALETIGQSTLASHHRERFDATIVEHEETNISSSCIKLESTPKCIGTENAIEDHIRKLLPLGGSASLQRHLMNFQTWSDRIVEFFEITKIAEASYGEVYRLSIKGENTSFTKADESVIKIVALKPPESLKAKLTKAQVARINLMSEPDDVANEVRLLKHMTSVPGFTNFRDLKIVRGRLPSHLCSAWRKFDRDIKRSEFPNPCRKSTHHDDQLWAIIEMQDAGRDLETIVAETVWICWDAFWGVAFALAKGEEWAAFEHRDLHLGNICIRWNDSANIVTEPLLITKGMNIGFTGLETTIIDYTLSRAEISGANAESSPEVAYFDLAKDPSLFQGDGATDFQYDIYRHMHSAVVTGDPSSQIDCPTSQPSRDSSFAQNQHHGSLWSQFHPLTNLIWLQFILHKLTMHSVVPSPKRGRKPLAACEIEKRRKAEELQCKLSQVQSMLKLTNLKEGILGSAGELVSWAIDQGWFEIEDVLGKTSG